MAKWQKYCHAAPEQHLLQLVIAKHACTLPVSHILKLPLCNLVLLAAGAQ